MKLFVYKVKEGKEQKLQEWSEYLNSHKDEVLETLNEEGIVFESLHMVTLNGERYAVGTVHSREGVKPTNMEREINQKHREVSKECLEPVATGENSYFFESNC